MIRSRHEAADVNDLTFEDVEWPDDRPDVWPARVRRILGVVVLVVFVVFTMVRAAGLL